MQVNKGSLDMLTEELITFMLSVAYGAVILMSHFDTDIIIHTDCTVLSLLGVFGEISF